MKIFLILLIVGSFFAGGQILLKEAVRSMWSTSGHQQGGLYMYEFLSIIILIILTIMYYRMGLLQKNPIIVGVIAVSIVCLTQYFVFFK